MALISLQEISLAFGGPLVFDKISLQLEAGERVALLGRNGAGKTTLMKVMAGQIGIDEGDIITQKGIQITHLPQEVPSGIAGTVFDIVAAGLGRRAQLLTDYHHVSHRLHSEQTPELLRELDRLQTELDKTGSWDINNQVEQVISHMKLDPESDFEKLSGGQKRRTLLAKALVIKPEILMLDEPTNHLDIDTINWLEEYLKKYTGTLFFVTHDRMFMTHLATRIMELDRGKIMSWSCDYRTFLERKQMALENEAIQQEQFDKKLAQEEVWIRQGIKARRTRNEGRVKALERMRQEKAAERKQMGNVKLTAHEAEMSGHLVIKASSIGFAYGDQCLIGDYSTQVMRGDKIGVIGANGSGKTTLLKILLGQLAPQKGKVRLGTNIQIAYYDQLREQLEEEKTVIENICGNADTVTINGRPRHIIGYLQDFLFSPERARTPVKVLSGGERNRLFLARLFTQPSNLLVMDEPTNDLDIETQELLEDLLLQYTGTLLLVSHDRAFLNNVVTSTIVLEGEGMINEYAGGYDDWINQSRGAAIKTKIIKKNNPLKSVEERPKPRKLSFKEQRELDQLTDKITHLEAVRQELCDRLADPHFYQSDSAGFTKASYQLQTLEEELLAVYQRWAYLEDLNTKPQ